MSYDLLIRGCRIIDGESAPAYRADVGIQDGIISAIGPLPDAEAERVLDCPELILSPGFIGHSHSHRLYHTDQSPGGEQDPAGGDDRSDR